MELDGVEREEGSWDATKLKNVAVIAIVVNSLLILIFALVAGYAGELRNIPPKDMPELPEEITIEDLISMIRVFLIIGMIVLAANIAGAAMMMKKSNTGWILFLVTNVLNCLMFGFSMVNGGLMPAILFIIFLSLTIFAGKHRYKPEENFENYTN